MTFGRLAIALVVISFALLVEVGGGAQTSQLPVRPDVKRALLTQPKSAGRKAQELRPRGAVNSRTGKRASLAPSNRKNIAATAAISPGTPLSRVLHTSQLDLTSTAGTNEQFFDRDNDLIADDRTTFDNAGGSFDIAVGRSGARYEVFSATIENQASGVLVVATDTNGDFVANTSLTFNLRRDFNLPSAAAVVSGVSSTNREFVVVSSSGFTTGVPNDPANEPSAGVVLLVRDPNTGGFDDTQTKILVTLGSNRLRNANGLALMPNNDLLIADFFTNELRIVRDTNGDRIPDTLDDVPYYEYQFIDDNPLDIAVNSKGVVFSHSVGNDTLMLAIYDDNHDGRGDVDEVVVEGLSIDNKLLMHGMAVDRRGTVYVIEDAASFFDGTGGNGGIARVDAFADPRQDGFLLDGEVFTEAEDDELGLTGLGFGPPSNLLQNTEFFVRQHYLDFLNRQADQSGLDFWKNNIDNCGADSQCREVKRIDTSAAFFLSIEFQQTGFLVYRLYKVSFPANAQRPRGLPRLQEFLTDQRTVGDGVIVGATGWEEKLNANITAFINAFVQRSEFQLNFPINMTAADYVDKLNTQSGGALSTTERNALVAGLSGGQETRATVLKKLVEDVDFRNAEFNRAFVLMQYFGYLRRNPDDAPDNNFSGYDFWLGKLNQFNGDFRAAEMVKAFITSGEYLDRFD
jgi:hypothetical protein